MRTSVWYTCLGYGLMIVFVSLSGCAAPAQDGETPVQNRNPEKKEAGSTDKTNRKDIRSSNAERSPKDLIEAVVTRKEYSYPVLPALPSAYRYRLKHQLAESKSIREAYAKLDARKDNNSWFEGISELEKEKAVFPLLSALCHHSEDTQIRALKSLRRLGDKRAVPFLLVYADYMAVMEQGSENATVHGIIHEEIANTLSALTGIKVEIEGQDVKELKKGIHLWKKWQLEQDEENSSSIEDRIFVPAKKSGGPALVYLIVTAQEDDPDTDDYSRIVVEHARDALAAISSHETEEINAVFFIQTTRESDYGAVSGFGPEQLAQIIKLPRAKAMSQVSRHAWSLSKKPSDGTNK